MMMEVFNDLGWPIQCKISQAEYFFYNTNKHWQIKWFNWLTVQFDYNIVFLHGKWVEQDNEKGQTIKNT